MECSINGVSGKDGGTQTGKRRYTVDGCGDPIECSGKCCLSCSAAIVADCVAVCCCPCALFNLLALAFVKFPLMAGRRCLGIGKKTGSKRKCEKSDVEFVVERDGSLRLEETGNEEDEMGRFNEEVWLELSQVDHLGFGRLSFT
ncbi:uncharacterized protein LOC110826158 [Carica papaya]|uniref:uncharacterized protein LOC110826158 n=1 Tax=Carica papaya TaxID=3649 RepID=UPI000B8CDA07|nr:uncharacterized protein LOC110826158 [Carica papaya]